MENVSISYLEGIGSNNWVISGKFTESGKPILANDPHLLLTAPPVWYEMHLKTKDFEVRGVTFPGIPFVIIGYNKHVAWGFTNVGADVIDFYAYVWKGGKYLYKGKWLSSRPKPRGC
ncbi:penicillin acylase family protein [Ferroglobus placidus]|uniref:penicillin acylase family protein n=1 Tax=Ferroglobus placidus TaxID=54261 RepID=UPI0001B77C5C|nr:penicillin acylase family protein [Ferroglobus placidus]